MKPKLTRRNFLSTLIGGIATVLFPVKALCGPQSPEPKRVLTPYVIRVPRKVGEEIMKHLSVHPDTGSPIFTLEEYTKRMVTRKDPTP